MEEITTVSQIRAQGWIGYENRTQYRNYIASICRVKLVLWTVRLEINQAGDISETQ
jgi:hypothetical protein